MNFVTCHDGFTLQDLVSYETKHNEANGEDNRDGTDNNLSRNWGVEGPAEATHVIRMRERIKRNFLATLAFSQGVPMISHGDELGRTQSGNNNAYCHDGPLTWIDWKLDPRAASCWSSPAPSLPSARRTPRAARGGLFPPCSRRARTSSRSSPGCGPTGKR